MGCEKSLPYTETSKGIIIDISSINIHDLKSHYVFGFKISNIKEQNITRWILLLLIFDASIIFSSIVGDGCE